MSLNYINSQAVNAHSHEKLAVASFWKVEQNSVYPQTSQISSITLSGYYHDVIKQQVNNSDETIQ